MKILIAADMEGVAGVVDWSYVDSRNKEYERFRRIMTNEVNAAIKGIFDAGAEEVVVADGHDGGKNIMIEMLDPRARLNSGSPAPFSMMQGIDKSVAAAMFIGYHARYGTQNGILAHTWSLGVTNAWLNDCLIGEIGVNASIAGYFNVPLLMISSDQAGCNEADEFIPGIETIAVKQGNGMSSAECLSPKVSCDLIREAAQRTVANFKAGKAPAPIHTSTPITIKLELNNSMQADRASVTPGAKRLDGRTLQMEVVDILEAYRAFRTMLSLAGPLFTL